MTFPIQPALDPEVEAYQESKDRVSRKPKVARIMPSEAVTDEPEEDQPKRTLDLDA